MGGGSSALPRDEHEMVRFQSLCDAFEKRRHFPVRVTEDGEAPLPECDSDNMLHKMFVPWEEEDNVYRELIDLPLGEAHNNQADYGAASGAMRLDDLRTRRVIDGRKYSARDGSDKFLYCGANGHWFVSTKSQMQVALQQEELDSEAKAGVQLERELEQEREQNLKDASDQIHCGHASVLWGREQDRMQREKEQQQHSYRIAYANATSTADGTTVLTAAQREEERWKRGYAPRSLPVPPPLQARWRVESWLGELRLNECLAKHLKRSGVEDEDQLSSIAAMKPEDIEKTLDKAAKELKARVVSAVEHLQQQIEHLQNNASLPAGGRSAGRSHVTEILTAGTTLRDTRHTNSTNGAANAGIAGVAGAPNGCGTAAVLALPVLPVHNAPVRIPSVNVQLGKVQTCQVLGAMGEASSCHAYAVAEVLGDSLSHVASAEASRTLNNMGAAGIEAVTNKLSDLNPDVRVAACETIANMVKVKVEEANEDVDHAGVGDELGKECFDGEKVQYGFEFEWERSQALRCAIDHGEKVARLCRPTGTSDVDDDTDDFGAGAGEAAETEWKVRVAACAALAQVVVRLQHQHQLNVLYKQNVECLEEMHGEMRKRFQLQRGHFIPQTQDDMDEYQALTCKYTAVLVAAVKRGDYSSDYSGSSSTALGDYASNNTAPYAYLHSDYYNSSGNVGSPVAAYNGLGEQRQQQQHHAVTVAACRALESIATAAAARTLTCTGPAGAGTAPDTDDERVAAAEWATSVGNGNMLAAQHGGAVGVVVGVLNRHTSASGRLEAYSGDGAVRGQCLRAIAALIAAWPVRAAVIDDDERSDGKVGGAPGGGFGDSAETMSNPDGSGNQTVPIRYHGGVGAAVRGVLADYNSSYDVRRSACLLLHCLSLHLWRKQKLVQMHKAKYGDSGDGLWNGGYISALEDEAAYPMGWTRYEWECYCRLQEQWVVEGPDRQQTQTQTDDVGGTVCTDASHFRVFVGLDMHVTVGSTNSASASTSTVSSMVRGDSNWEVRTAACRAMASITKTLVQAGCGITIRDIKKAKALAAAAAAAEALADDSDDAEADADADADANEDAEAEVDASPEWVVAESACTEHISLVAQAMLTDKFGAVREAACASLSAMCHAVDAHYRGVVGKDEGGNWESVTNMMGRRFVGAVALLTRSTALAEQQLQQATQSDDDRSSDNNNNDNSNNGNSNATNELWEYENFDCDGVDIADPANKWRNFRVQTSVKGGGACSSSTSSSSSNSSSSSSDSDSDRVCVYEWLDMQDVKVEESAWSALAHMGTAGHACLEAAER